MRFIFLFLLFFMKLSVFTSRITLYRLNKKYDIENDSKIVTFKNEAHLKQVIEETGSNDINLKFSVEKAIVEKIYGSIIKLLYLKVSIAVQGGEISGGYSLIKIPTRFSGTMINRGVYSNSSGVPTWEPDYCINLNNNIPRVLKFRFLIFDDILPTYITYQMKGYKGFQNAQNYIESKEHIILVTENTIVPVYDTTNFLRILTTNLVSPDKNSILFTKSRENVIGSFKIQFEITSTLENLNEINFEFLFGNKYDEASVTYFVDTRKNESNPNCSSAFPEIQPEEILKQHNTMYQGGFFTNFNCKINSLSKNNTILLYVSGKVTGNEPKEGKVLPIWLYVNLYYKKLVWRTGYFFKQNSVELLGNSSHPKSVQNVSLTQSSVESLNKKNLGISKETDGDILVDGEAPENGNKSDGDVLVDGEASENGNKSDGDVLIDGEAPENGNKSDVLIYGEAPKNRNKTDGAVSTAKDNAKKSDSKVYSSSFKNNKHSNDEKKNMTTDVISTKFTKNNKLPSSALRKKKIFFGIFFFSLVAICIVSGIIIFIKKGKI